MFENIIDNLPAAFDWLACVAAFDRVNVGSFYLKI